MEVGQVREQIQKLVSEALLAKGFQTEKLTDNTLLLGGSLGIDSLDLAAIVVNLSEISQKDPFADGFIDFRTVGELAQLYAASDGR
jgi:acyl carrier protein